MARKRPMPAMVDKPDGRKEVDLSAAMAAARANIDASAAASVAASWPEASGRSPDYIWQPPPVAAQADTDAPQMSAHAALGLAGGALAAANAAHVAVVAARAERCPLGEASADAPRGAWLRALAFPNLHRSRLSVKGFISRVVLRLSRGLLRVQEELTRRIDLLEWSERRRRPALEDAAAALLHAQNLMAATVQALVAQSAALESQVLTLTSTEAGLRAEVDHLRQQLEPVGPALGQLSELLGQANRDLAVASAEWNRSAQAINDARASDRDAIMNHLTALAVRLSEAEILLQRLPAGMDENRRESARLSDELAAVRTAVAQASRSAAMAPVLPIAAAPAPVDREALVDERAVAVGAAGFDFHAWENQTRGSEEHITSEQERYVPIFAGAPGPVLDAGCGRGELLKLLRSAQIEAYGIDLDAPMVEVCQGYGLQVVQGEILEHLATLPDDSLGGIAALQVVEHLELRALAALAHLAFSKLRSGGAVVLETINPQCLSVFSGAFFADPTHTKPVHPEALSFMLKSAGFVGVEIIYSAPVPDHEKLAPLREKEPIDPVIKDIFLQTEANFTRLNSLLYGSANFAAVARKP